MKDLKNEEILKMIENMTVKEVVELIESLEDQHNIPQESDEVKQDKFLCSAEFQNKGESFKTILSKR